MWRDLKVPVRACIHFKKTQEVKEKYLQQDALVPPGERELDHGVGQEVVEAGAHLLGLRLQLLVLGGVGQVVAGAERPRVWLGRVGAHGVLLQLLVQRDRAVHDLHVVVRRGDVACEYT